MRRAGDAVAAAKLWLIADAGARLPYLARGLYALVTVETTEVPRIASDEHWRLYVNPDWAASVEVESLARDLAHELWHLLLDHAGRARSVGVARATAAAWHRVRGNAVASRSAGIFRWAITRMKPNRGNPSPFMKARAGRCPAIGRRWMRTAASSGRRW